MEWIKDWWMVIFGVGGFLSGIASWAFRKEFASKKEVGAVQASAATALTAVGRQIDKDLKTLKGEIDGLGQRTAKLEQELSHLPTKDDFNALSTAQASMKADLSALVKSQEAQGQALIRIESYLLNEGKRR